MCQIIHIKGNELPADLETRLGQEIAYGNNDGAGAMVIGRDGEVEVARWFRQSLTGWNNPKSIVQWVRAARKRHNGLVETAIHLRYATHGDKSKANCHPFLIPSVGDSAVSHGLLMHNGTFSLTDPKGKAADSALFAMLCAGKTLEEIEALRVEHGANARLLVFINGECQFHRLGSWSSCGSDTVGYSSFTKEHWQKSKLRTRGSGDYTHDYTPTDYHNKRLDAVEKLEGLDGWYQIEQHLKSLGPTMACDAAGLAIMRERRKCDKLEQRLEGYKEWAFEMRDELEFADRQRDAFREVAKRYGIKDIDVEAEAILDRWEAEDARKDEEERLQKEAAEAKQAEELAALEEMFREERDTRVSIGQVDPGEETQKMEPVEAGDTTLIVPNGVGTDSESGSEAALSLLTAEEVKLRGRLQSRGWDLEIFPQGYWIRRKTVKGEGAGQVLYRETLEDVYATTIDNEQWSKENPIRLNREYA